MEAINTENDHYIGTSPPNQSLHFSALTAIAFPYISNEIRAHDPIKTLRYPFDT